VEAKALIGPFQCKEQKLDIFFVSKAVENAVFGEPFLINPVMS
jgi:hypothetical protein